MNVDEADRVREGLMDRARQLGADGIIIHKSDVLEKIGLTHRNPFGAGEGAQEGGSLFGSSWFAEESLSDSIELTQYLSVTSIKFKS